jgi:hypothetical protein
VAASVTAGAQDRRAVRLEVASPAGQVSSGALSDAIFANVPFSADAVTTVTQTLGDGTKIEQRTTTKWYRDSLGRVRREQTVIGLDRLNPSAPPQTTITFDSVPGDQSPYTLNPATKTARRAPRGVQWLERPYAATIDGGLYFSTASGNLAAGNLAALVDSLTNQPGRRVRLQAGRAGLQAAPIPSDLKPVEEQLNARQIEGVKATGSRSTTTIPAGRIGNDRPIQIVEEQWDSPDLNMVVLSRFSDPRTGVVEYRLTNINRSEPRADLFQVPSDYAVIENAPGLRTGGAGGRGAAPAGQGGGRGGRGN